MKIKILVLFVLLGGFCTANESEENDAIYCTPSDVSCEACVGMPDCEFYLLKGSDGDASFCFQRNKFPFGLDGTIHYKIVNSFGCNTVKCSSTTHSEQLSTLMFVTMICGVTSTALLLLAIFVKVGQHVERCKKPTNNANVRRWRGLWDN